MCQTLNLVVSPFQLPLDFIEILPRFYQRFYCCTNLHACTQQYENTPMVSVLTKKIYALQKGLGAALTQDGTPI